jgi:glycosyltransferase involved in cell wall biosynthesis
MKVLHSAMAIGHQPGILNQMAWEQEAARQLGIRWDSRLYVPSSNAPPGGPSVASDIPLCSANAGLLQRLTFWVKFRKAYYRWLREQASRYDVILLRHAMYDPFRAGFIRDSGIPVFSVHHTLEIPEIRGRKEHLVAFKALAEKFLGGHSIAAAAGIIGVTEEIAQYEWERIGAGKKLRYVYPNGVLFRPNEQMEIADHRSDEVPEILFVASHFAPWHGLDLLLSTLSATDEQFVLHLVGHVPEVERRAAQGDSRVVLHGMKGHSEIATLSEFAWVGLSSFALERKGMKEACTLKVREYLSSGLPVYAGYRDVFPIEFSGYREGPPDIREIIAYAKACRPLDRREIAMHAEPYISKTKLLIGLKAWLDTACARPEVSP